MIGLHSSFHLLGISLLINIAYVAVSVVHLQDSLSSGAVWPGASMLDLDYLVKRFCCNILTRLHSINVICMLKNNEDLIFSLLFLSDSSSHSKEPWKYFLMWTMACGAGVVAIGFYGALHFWHPERLNWVEGILSQQFHIHKLNTAAVLWSLRESEATQLLSHKAHALPGLCWMVLSKYASLWARAPADYFI